MKRATQKMIEAGEDVLRRAWVGNIGNLAQAVWIAMHASRPR